MSASDCVFCKIRDGKIPSPKLLENDSFFCVRDIQPQAKQHLLVIPKVHVATLEEGIALVGGLFEFASQVARQEGLSSGGYRAVINNGAQAGQTVFHLHLHLLGGQALRSGFA